MASTATSARDLVFSLQRQRHDIEQELKLAAEQLGSVGMTAPLVDDEGYPRADVDLYQVRTLRQKVIMLRNDLARKNGELERALEALHALGPMALASLAPLPMPASAHSSSTAASSANQSSSNAAVDDEPIALVDGVSAGSPADAAGLQPGDKICAFGDVRMSTLAPGSDALLAISRVVGASEGRAVAVNVLRAGARVALSLTPRAWAGRGLLGCHVVAAATR